MSQGDYGIKLNLDMVREGAGALRAWDRELEAEELIVVEIFYRMLDALHGIPTPISIAEAPKKMT